MLVLSRKKNGKVVVVVPPSAEPQPIEFVIVEIRGGKVRVGIEASKEVVVHREEIWQAIQRDRERLAARGIETDFRGQPISSIADA